MTVQEWRVKERTVCTLLISLHICLKIFFPHSFFQTFWTDFPLSSSFFSFLYLPCSPPPPPLSCLQLIIAYCAHPQWLQFIKQDSCCHDHHRLIWLTGWMTGWPTDRVNTALIELVLFILSPCLYFSLPSSLSLFQSISAAWVFMCACACQLLCALRVQGLHVIL